MAEDVLKKQQAANITPDKPVDTTQTVYRTDAEGNDASYTIAGNIYKVDQETTNQLVLDEAAAAQTRLNMMTAADEDKYLKTHFTSEEMRAADKASMLDAMNTPYWIAKTQGEFQNALATAKLGKAAVGDMIARRKDASTRGSIAGINRTYFTG